MPVSSMAPAMRVAWLRTLGRLVLVLLAGMLLGATIGHFWMCTAVVALLVVAWHYWRLRRLLERLTARQRIEPPDGAGVWNELDRLLARGQREMRARKRRLITMLRAYRAAAAALPDGVLVIERRTRELIWFNEAAQRLLGLNYPSDLHAHLHGRLPTLPIAQWLASEGQAEILDDVASPVDDVVRLNLRLLPYSEEFWLIVVRDVSKMMRLEHMRRDFVANVSHELRTPLTVLHGYLEMLDDGEQPQWTPLFAEMQRQTHRMNRLVDDLLKLARLEVQDRLENERVAMQPMLEALQREAVALSGQRHRIEVLDEAGVDLRGADRELHSAFSNLVSNAVRYTPPQGRIAIRFFRTPQGVALSVSDSGYGIPADHLPRLTERFYRVSTSRSRESGGTGLGLSIVKHILNLHQARLLINSEVGSGSVFTCSFGAERVLDRLSAVSSSPP